MNRIVIFLLLIPFLAAQNAAEVEITAESSHHLVFENDSVRVFSVEVAPGTSTLMHRHRHDYVFVTLGNSHVSNEVEGKQAVDLVLANGETRFVSGNFAHIAKDLSDQPFRNVTIEIMQDGHAGQKAEGQQENGGDSTLPGSSTKILFVKDGVRVSEVDLEPGAVTPKHHHTQPHLIVAVSDLKLRSDIEGKSPVVGEFKIGETKWVAGDYTHTLTNVGASAARFIALEF